MKKNILKRVAIFISSGGDELTMIYNIAEAKRYFDKILYIGERNKKYDKAGALYIPSVKNDIHPRFLPAFMMLRNAMSTTLVMLGEYTFIDYKYVIEDMGLEEYRDVGYNKHGYNNMHRVISMVDDGIAPFINGDRADIDIDSTAAINDKYEWFANIIRNTTANYDTDVYALNNMFHVGYITVSPWKMHDAAMHYLGMYRQYEHIIGNDRTLCLMLWNIVITSYHISMEDNKYVFVADGKESYPLVKDTLEKQHPYYDLIYILG